MTPQNGSVLASHFGGQEIPFNELRLGAITLAPDEAEIVFRIAVTRFGVELARKAYRKT